MPDDNIQPSDSGTNQWSGGVSGLGTPPGTPVTYGGGDMQVQPTDQTVPADVAQPTQVVNSSDTFGLPANANDLLDIKSKALSQLSPIVGHLDQTPEEKFKTTMMMIQASDNQGLIKDAYEAAQQITDEKVKAQALLDVVNEINYFTRQAAS